MGAALSSGPWLVCADAGGKNTHAVQILTATFTELIKSHALNLQVLLGLSDFYQCNRDWLHAATGIFSSAQSISCPH